MASSDVPLREQRPGVIQRVLVAFDASAGSRRALRVAHALAAQVGGRLFALYVSVPHRHGESNDAQSKAMETGGIERVIAEELSDVIFEVPVTTSVVVSEHPALALDAFAHEHGIDVMVLGTHGTDAVMHRGAGRTLEKLLQKHSCPVIVV